MTAANGFCAPDLVMIDAGAPLEESLRRLQCQLTRVELLAARETSAQPADVPAAAFIASLLHDYNSKATTASSDGSEKATRMKNADATVALRRRVAQKLRRLSEEQHTDLCVARTSLDDADLNAVVPSIQPLPTAVAGTPAHGSHEATLPHGTAGRGLRACAAVGEEEEEDLFDWVTSASAPAVSRAEMPAAVNHAAPLKAATATVDEDAILQRIAQALADLVEARYRHADEIQDALQQLRQAQRRTCSLLSVADTTKGSAEERPSPTSATSMAASCSRDDIRALLSFHPSHSIATDAEAEVWQRAWQAVLPAASASELVALKVGDVIEVVDVAVLAHVNAQRAVALQQRWCAVQANYRALVEQLNRRLAQAALQLEELER